MQLMLQCEKNYDMFLRSEIKAYKVIYANQCTIII